MWEWLSSWSMMTWAFAWGLIVLTFIVAVILFGRETVTGWISAVWKRFTGKPVS